MIKVMAALSVHLQSSERDVRAIVPNNEVKHLQLAQTP
jgi:hypothetical protein